MTIAKFNKRMMIVYEPRGAGAAAQPPEMRTEVAVLFYCFALHHNVSSLRTAR